MAFPPAKLREIIFLMLYSRDFHESDSKELTRVIMRELEVSKKNTELAFEKFAAIMKYIEEIDAIIKRKSISYDIKRIHSIERTILRLSIYELLYEKEIPFKVVIAEAKRLAKKFSTKEAASFIHAILDACLQPNEEKKSANEES